ncbi:NAD(P)-binding protein [Thozetella sp. PMI_491]|nr:NAD(P)-binding protein [Thozetella sp. PMI_491]
MSANMKEIAARQTSFSGIIRKQVCHRVPQIPAHVSLRGKTAVVTGSNCGLGLECARQFLQLEAERVILAVRSQSKGDAAANQLRAEHPKASIEVWILDMESVQSVRSFAARCETLDSLDVVVLNAGCGKQVFQRCDGGKGREITLQVNYLSTALLTLLLVPILKAKRKSSPARLTIVTSDMAYYAKMNEPATSILGDMDSKEGFEGMAQYGKSKLLVTMFVSKLPEVVDTSDVIINAVNPSAVRGTDLMRDAKGQYLAQAFVYTSNALLGRNLVDGTRQYVHSALVLGKESHGSWTDWEIRPYPPSMYTELGYSLTERLWKETLVELGITDIKAALEGVQR